MTSIFSPFATGFALSAALILAIGAQNLFVLRQGLKREHIGAIVLFCASADAILIGAGVAGLGTLTHLVPHLADALALAGALFLGWHGIAAFRCMTASEAMVVTGQGGVTLAQAMAATAGFTFLNPHVYLDTVLLMGAAGSAQPAALRPLFVAGAASASFAWFVTLGYGARYLQPLFARPAAWRVLDAIVGVVMLTLAGSLVMRVAG